MGRVAWIVCGLVLLMGVVPAAMVVWFTLPPGTYPAVLAGIGGLPLVWAGLTCLKRAGWPVDRFVSERPRTTACLIVMLFIAVFFVAIVLDIY